MWSTILDLVNSGDTTASPAKFYYGVKQKSQPLAKLAGPVKQKP
jgi:hypothetical protein